MYLSKLALNPRSREARRDLAHPYELHRTLAHAFPTPNGQDYRAIHNVLFRIELAAQPSAYPTVLVQSATPPAWDNLPNDYLRQSIQCKPLAPVLTAGQVLGFRLVANPTKKVNRNGQRQGKRVPLFDTGSTDDELTPAQHWLRRKAELGGFEVLHVFSEAFSLYTGRGVTTVSHSTKQQLPLYGVRFDGLLRITDPQQLATTLFQGIGSAKAFGFGLLSLARPVSNGLSALI